MPNTLPINLPVASDRGIGETMIYIAPTVAVSAGAPVYPPATGAGALAYLGMLDADGASLDDAIATILYKGGEEFGPLGVNRGEDNCLITGNLAVCTREAMAIVNGLTVTTSMTASVSSLACSNITGANPLKMPLGNPSKNVVWPEWRVVLSVAAPGGNFRRLISIWKAAIRRTGATAYKKGDYQMIPIEIQGIKDMGITAAGLAGDLAVSRYGTIEDATA